VQAGKFCRAVYARFTMREQNASIVPPVIAMKINTAFAPIPLGQASAKPAVAVSGFHLPVLREATSARPAAPLRAASSLGLIAAIADEDGRQGRRQKRQAHAGALLDRLDDLARGLALGQVDSGMVERLAAGLGAAQETSDDPALEALVEAIELRVAVEIAKMKVRTARF
jgi:hypothetical protein